MKEIMVELTEIEEYKKLLERETANNELVQEAVQAAIKMQGETRSQIVKEKRDWWLKMAPKYDLDLEKNKIRVDFVKNVLVDDGPRQEPPGRRPLIIPGGLR